MRIGLPAARELSAVSYGSAALAPSGTNPAPLKGGAMDPAIPGHETMDPDERSVHNWRVFQLMRLGVSEPLAEIYADRIDWHQIARLVRRGCPPQLALRIAV